MKNKINDSLYRLGVPCLLVDRLVSITLGGRIIMSKYRLKIKEVAPKFAYSDLEPGDMFVLHEHNTDDMRLWKIKMKNGGACYLLDGDTEDYSEDRKVYPIPDAYLSKGGI